MATASMAGTDDEQSRFNRIIDAGTDKPIDTSKIALPGSGDGEGTLTPQSPQKLPGGHENADHKVCVGGAGADVVGNVGDVSHGRKPGSWWAERKAWLRRHRTIVIASAVFTLVIFIVLLVVGLVVVDRDNQLTRVVVDLGYAQYQGVELGTGVSQFLGMRYAAAPVGNLRWRAPIPPPQTQGVQNATQFQPICLGINMGYPVLGQDEDCLWANVWAPTGATSDLKLPVWVFIQGGGYNINSNGNWNGAEVVEKSGKNIVMVEFNYRVGIWGFLASERVREDGDLNAGMLDQRLLLQWVKAHISQFGGDPNHVVIHGSSAGAGSVALHMVAYGGRNDNLFVGGIAESIFFPSQPMVSDLEWQFDRVTQQTGCNISNSTQQMSCLRGLTTQALQGSNVAQEFPGRHDPPLPLFYWTPAVDGDFLEDIPYNLYDQGRIIPVPLIFGTTTDEGSIFASNAATPSDVVSFMANNYPRLTPNDTDEIMARYPKLPPLPLHAAWFPAASRIYGEATFTCPGINTLNMVRDTITATATDTNPINSTTGLNSTLNRALQPYQIYSYRYNVQDDQNTAEGLGVLHLFSSAAVFGPDNINGARESYYTYNAPIVPVVMAYWISFVRALDPNAYRDPSAPVWQPWGADMNRMVLETGASRMENTPTDELDRCTFWAGLGRTMQQKR